MERDYGMEQLFCGCSKPAVTTMESGNHWCDDCGGLVPEEKVRAWNTTAKEILDDLMERGFEKPHRLVGPALFVCNFCWGHDWMKYDADQEKVMKALQRLRMIQCGHCGKNNGLTKAWDVMIK